METCSNDTHLLFLVISDQSYSILSVWLQIELNPATQCTPGSVLLQGLCHVCSSGSGAIFGLLVLFIADMAFNFEAIRFPILRILAAAILLGVFIAAAIVQGLPARLSILGGALTALLPVLSLLPHLKSEKFEWWIPYASVFTTFGFLLALPLYVYLKRLPGVSC